MNTPYRRCGRVPRPTGGRQPTRTRLRTRSGWRGLALLALAAQDPALTPIVRDTWYGGGLDFFRRQLTSLRDEGGLAPGIDPNAAAHETQLLTEGLRAPLLLGHLSTEQGLEIVDRHLDRLFGYP